MVGQRGQDLGRRARDVEEEADAVLVPALAQCLGERHQMIIMHPDQILRREHLVQLAREMIVDPQIAAQIAARELGEIDAIVQDRPQHTIGEAVVVFLVVLPGEVDGDVGDLVVHDLLCRNFVCVVTFPLNRTRCRSLSLNAAFTATSSPPARCAAFLSGIATLFDTMTSRANNRPPGSATA